MTAFARTAIRILGTLAVSALIWWSLATPDQGILREVRAFGPLWTSGIVAVFLALVVAYARDLHRLMQAVPLPARTASPASVWWMLLIPYNFTEDFFIIAAVATSLTRAEAADPALRGAFGRHGRWSGFGWCALQIGSLVPHVLGSAAGILALPLWLWHWRFVRKARQTLTRRPVPTPPEG